MRVNTASQIIRITAWIGPPSTLKKAGRTRLFFFLLVVSRHYLSRCAHLLHHYHHHHHHRHSAPAPAPSPGTPLPPPHGLLVPILLLLTNHSLGTTAVAHLVPLAKKPDTLASPPHAASVPGIATISSICPKILPFSRSPLAFNISLQSTPYRTPLLLASHSLHSLQSPSFFLLSLSLYSFSLLHLP